MKLIHLLLGANLICVETMLGQTNQANRLFIPYLDQESQSNVIVTVSDLFGEGQSCPLEYTNLTSNTNFFTIVEQKLLQKIALKYKNVTTNSGPSGTVLVGLYKTNFIVPFVHKTNEEWVAHFQYTNSPTQDEITFLDYETVSVKFQTDSQNVYFASMRGNSLRAFGQIKHDVVNGFCASFENNRLWLYQYVTNGLVFGKYFMWNPQNGNLLLEAEFKEPYDLNKHRLNPYSP